MASYEQKQRTQSEVDASSCEGCKKSFTDKKSKLLCEYCDSLYCIECLQLTVSAYNVFKKSSMHWFCSQCEEKIMRNIRTDREMEERCSAFLKRLESGVEALESQICNKVDETKVREIVQSINTDNEQTDNFQLRSVSESVLTTVKDCRNSSNQETNFIMYRVKVSPSDFLVGWLFWVKLPFEPVFQSISGRPERGRKRRERIEESKNVKTTPTRTYCKSSRPLPYSNPNCRTPGTGSLPRTIAPPDHPYLRQKIRMSGRSMIPKLCKNFLIVLVPKCSGV